MTGKAVNHSLLSVSCPHFHFCLTLFTDSDETIDGIELQHSLSLGSACGTPEYTNYTKGFNGCLDYIFYDLNKLKVTEVIPFPTHEEVTQNVAIPNIFFPSDHLALVCTLAWI